MMLSYPPQLLHSVKRRTNVEVMLSSVQSVSHLLCVCHHTSLQQLALQRAFAPEDVVFVGQADAIPFERLRAFVCRTAMLAGRSC